jgi:hypothetical protein
MSAPPHGRKDHVHIRRRAGGGVDNMAIGGGKVVFSGAWASCAMSLHAILARMASRGAARGAHSSLMRQIAA